MTPPEDKPRGRMLDALLRDRTISGTVTSESSGTVPRGVRVAAAYAWRFLVIAAAVAVAIWLVIELSLLVIPLLVAILLTALLWPTFSLMVRHRVPRWVAIIISVLGTIAIVTGLFWVAAWQISAQWESVRDRTVEATLELRDFLINGPLHLTAGQIDGALTQIAQFLRDQVDLLLSGVLALGTTVGHVATGILLTFFILLCLLADGGGIWKWTTKLFPRPARVPVDGAARAGWVTIVNYARTQLLVATIDAIGIGLGAFLLGVPLAVPIGVLVFLGAFIPFVGAIVTGAIAVFLALVYNGPWIAFWVLVVVLGVQQLESHVLQPLLMGSAVKVHPLAVVLVVAGGAMVGGIAGALFAVPLAAFVNVVVLYIAHRTWETGSRPPPDDLIWSTIPRQRRNPQ